LCKLKAKRRKAACLFSRARLAAKSKRSSWFSLSGLGETQGLTFSIVKTGKFHKIFGGSL
ncbi:hypothetical protein, partial [Pediococcus pentosaceus]|uniref:hypothetical protein n=1 Tax=Pediococcus pentosaceus TaxID=1255 RepID=UPI001E2E5AFA